jgi:hypothetical protein
MEKGLVNKEFQTGIFTSSGWNYLALTMERTVKNVYGANSYYNTLTFYAGHASFQIQSLDSQ